MSSHAGVLRDGLGLRTAAAGLAELAASAGAEPATENWEATNLLTVAAALVRAAQRREETRGSHWRADFPSASQQWCGHLETSLSPSGELETVFVPLEKSCAG
jgi:L-aspartate oxidase